MRVRDWVRRRPAVAATLGLGIVPLVTMIVGGVGGLTYSLSLSTPYEARSQVVVSPASGFLDPARVNSFPSIANSVARLAPTQRVLSDALVRLDRSGLRRHTMSWLTGRMRVHVNSASTAAIPTGSTTTPTNTKTTTAAETVAPTGGIRLLAFSRGETDRVTIGTTRNLMIGAIAGLLVGFLSVARLPSTRPAGVGVSKEL